MPRKWKELLADRSIPDDFAISMGGETITLGSLRSQDQETEGAVTRRLSEVEKREKFVNDASIGIATMLEKVSVATGLSTDELLNGKLPTKREVARGTDLDENDPLVGQLVKEIKSLRADVTSANSRYDDLKKNAIGPMLNTYLDDYYELQWDRLSGSVPEGAEVTRDKAIEYANKSGYKDAKGRLDLSKALKDLTYEARVKVEAKKLAAEERKKMEDEMALRNAPRPSQLGQRMKTDRTLQKEVAPGRFQTKDFDDVLNDALQDTDIWKSSVQ